MCSFFLKIDSGALGPGSNDIVFIEHCSSWTGLTKIRFPVQIIFSLKGGKMD